MTRPAVVAPATDARWERVVRVFQDTLDKTKTPGGAVAIVLDGKPAMAAGLGVRARDAAAPITTKTLFRLESVTKTFTALAAMTLVEREEIDIDRPVTDFISQLQFADPATSKQLTLRRLLTHTSGLSRNQIKDLRHVRKGFEYTDIFARNPLALGPPDKFEYSNTGYVVVGAAIERAAKRPYDDVLRERVLTPLGMANATPDADIAATREFAYLHGFDQTTGEWIAPPPKLDPYVQRPVGGLHASIDELALFASRYLVEAPGVVKPETFAEITKNRVATDEANLGYGYGIYVMSSPAHGPVWMHTGGGQGSTAYFVCAPKKRFALVVATNSAKYFGWRDVHRAAEEAFLGSALF